ncbi:leucine-rich repeat and calponin homology domain-containing protein [Episyrphus balteatus]|uniref:leucine-rich repeat and calponin homology domain-containing protein n=1 Tax=Episyrphus balteatus TaxID=286459 RepID=UPI002486C0F1|nr:leucine-rich repeat and calponin homology domain-containing protein [Episyrphus balteatus]
MAVTFHCTRIHNSTTTGHSQLVRSLERILEEANFSGELILTNRKLKDFPKAATKYNLSDTVIADLSRNRFCELPEEVTTFAFLETLLLYHNTIRHIPESVKHLTLLTYLDLRSNQLSTLPKELCFMPLQVLLVSNNRLVSLPDELGRMDKLLDLDVSYNQLTALPARVGELRSLKSFSLRNNQILYLPRELACLTLVSLDVSNNRIASLPLEIRQMTSLVEFNLGNNPLTSPPASLCVRGLVHIFKFLETQATKDEKGCRAGGNYDGYTTLRRAPKQNAGSIFESTRNPRYQVDSGYSTCDGMEKRWSNDLPNKNSKIGLLSPRKILPSSVVDSFALDADTSTNDIISKPSQQVIEEQRKDQQSLERTFSQENQLNEDIIIYSQTSSTSSGSTPEDDMLGENHMYVDKNNEHLGNIQTYREYKEALKQQRNQDISSVYKAKSKTQYDLIEDNGSCSYDEQDSRCMDEKINNINNYSDQNTAEEQPVCVPKKPIQKVIPSRNIELMSAVFQTKLKDKASILHGNSECLEYVKPSSPIKAVGNIDMVINNNSTPANGVVRNKFLPGMIAKHQLLLSQNKPNRSVTWTNDTSAEKSSFTMRREFDRQREETELMTQLRNIIQVRLKTILPEDMASALTDGIILCHLANYVRPRSVASIHVPSPGVSKLTMARCRRNVDNFLEACRKIGVDEELICSCEDVISPQDEECSLNDDYKPPLLPNPSAVFKTISALLSIPANYHQESQKVLQDQEQHYQSMEDHQPPATNMQLTENWENKLNTKREMTTSNNQFEDEVVDTKGSQLKKFLRHAKIKTFQKIKLNLINNNSNLKINSSGGKESQLQTIEETDADSYQIVNEKISPLVLKVNDLNTIKFKLFEITPNNNNEKNEDTQTVVSQCLSKSNVTVISDPRHTPKMVYKRIEFFEDKSVSHTSRSDDVNTTSKNICSIYQTSNEDSTLKYNTDECALNHDFNLLTVVLAFVFIATFILLVIFPLPD